MRKRHWGVLYPLLFRACFQLFQIKVPVSRRCSPCLLTWRARSDLKIFYERSIRQHWKCFRTPNWLCECYWWFNACFYLLQWPLLRIGSHGRRWRIQCIIQRVSTVSSMYFVTRKFRRSRSSCIESISIPDKRLRLYSMPYWLLYSTTVFSQNPFVNSYGWEAM